MTDTKISKLMVANRGEIALRVLRAASELRIRTVAIYTFEDRYSLHRYKADEAYQIGSKTDPLKPYLDIEEIIQVAQTNGVEAIHPGYGFLSENVRFAEACKKAGIIFVGPEPEVMERLGDKVKAKEVAKLAGVPLIEDSKEPLDSIEVALSEAHRIGYPIMVKAASGGGGRGMRVVRSDDDLQTAFVESRRESLNAFGDDTIFLEKFVENPKHIEVQIIGDKHGNILHLFERDCSVQRRFQKVVEVAPAPNLRQETKTALHNYALKIAEEVQYSNAGTVEFLVDEQENIYFIEVNPRIQVEHTVTEEITGIDIVRTQILIAAGKRLDSRGIGLASQDSIECNGFAIQCRVTTEDPKNDFKPDYGTIIAYRSAGGFGIRIDEGSSYPGVTISPFFDSLLAKLTARGRTLAGASQRLNRALREFRVRGVKTNVDFLQNVLEHEIFAKGEARVNFIADHPDLIQYRKRQDRATRIIGYLANVAVNGNPDVKFVDASVNLKDPRIPAFNPYAPCPDGTKQRLDAGRDAFLAWLKAEKEVKITDTTFRDAHQSLIATRVRTRDLLKVARPFAQKHPQTFSMEVWGGATFDVALRFLKECPWERLKMIREAVPNILLQMLLRGSNAVGYTAYPDNLIEKFIVHSWETGVDVFRIFDSLNWVENMKVSIKTVREETGGIAEACLCYTGDISNPEKSKYDLQYYIDLARRLEDAGAHMLAVKDMAGLLKPYAAEMLISSLKEAVALPIHLHTHDTSSAQLATYLKAVEAGVDIVDLALSSMSGLTSQPNLNTFLNILENSPRSPKFDLSSLNDFSNYWEIVREWYYPFESGLKAGTGEVYQHEIPGGQYSNLGTQARSLGLDDRMPEIKKAYKEVNDLFGDIVKVTPSSKVVGDLALYMVSNGYQKNDIVERGHEISFPESTKNFFMGRLGQPHQGFPEKMQDMVLKGQKPLTGRANEALDQIDFDRQYAAFQEEFPERNGFSDFLSYLFYPKVFKDYYESFKQYGNIGVLPSRQFFYPMEIGQETIFEMSPGKRLLIKLVYMDKTADAEGYRNVQFKLNGQTRTLRVRDESVKVDTEVHQKASQTNHVGAPLQGLLSQIFVEAGQAVEKNTPLFVIEAMKMETTITASTAGKIQRIYLNAGTLVDADDLVVELAEEQ